MILTLDEIVKRTKDLPVFSPTAQEVMRATGNADTAASTIASLIIKDQALALKVLRLANSSYYGLPRKIESLEQAVVILGVRSIRNLALAAATYPWLVRPLKGYDLGPKELWLHSFAVGGAASCIARASRAVDPELALTSGMVHDLGMVTLSIWLESKASALLHYAKREGLAFDQVEAKVLGFDHAQVGAHLAENWNIPAPIVEAVRWHHHPSKAPVPSALTDCVHLGIEATKKLGIGLNEKGIDYHFDPASFDRLGLTEVELDHAAEQVRSSLEEYRQLLEEQAAAA
jgi:HD-like signal output (HDOD) protein